ncbi:trypsin-like [Phymastichus coffea]|uniref:trypsin-like n=1 Tax=Phymastichus coffea TaxID=108790 RepID=UPI00273B86B8|nr:trypsin-like [Phymastichus coffea]
MIALLVIVAVAINVPILSDTAEAATMPAASFPKGLLAADGHADIKEVPYQAIIIYRDRPICGGAIISEHHILTAAHCLLWGPSEYQVRLGSNLRDHEGSLHDIREHRLHELYYEDRDYQASPRKVPVNDLAIIELSESIDFDYRRQAIKLYDYMEDVGVGAEALVTGWYVYKHNFSAEHLTTKVVQTLDMSLCNKAYEDIGGVPAGQICAGYPGSPGRTGCLGDSGGPLVVNGRLAGILSWGNGCMKARYPGLYTEIAYYRDWIERKGRDQYSLWTP